MSDDPQVVSISSSVALSPDEIAQKSFPPARKGLDGKAVRAFLDKAAAGLRAALEREAELRERVADAERRAADPELDEATLTRAIGVETAKILWAAHDAANNLATKAEEEAAEFVSGAEKVLAEQVAIAEAEALKIRAAAEQEVAEYKRQVQAEVDSVTEAAQGDAVELLDATKEECRQMVAEARELRNHTLADLAARRRDMRIQLEELRAGKDALLRVVDMVGASVEELRERLIAAEDEARVAADKAGQRATEEPGSGDLAELEAELATVHAGLAGPDYTEGREAAGESAPPAEDAEEEGIVGQPSPGDGDAKRGRHKRGTTASRRSVDELFARIRASRAGDEALSEEVSSAVDAADADLVVEIIAEVLDASGGAEPTDEVSFETGGEVEETTVVEELITETEIVEEESETIDEPSAAVLSGPDAESLAHPDRLVAAITAKLARSLKRALQDDQNELLNALRQTTHEPVLDELVPPEAQRERFVGAVSAQLAKAYEAGATFLLAGEGATGPFVTALAPEEAVASEAGVLLGGELADELAGMLRQRVEEMLGELEGSLEGAADAAGVAYREWKGARVEGLAGDFTTRAFSVGELAVLSQLGEGEAPRVHWVVADDGGACPDCDDNSLAGEQPPGEEFPTGHSHPPVHPGCRCLLVPVRS
jgi:DivIVA domain-containing protein